MRIQETGTGIVIYAEPSDYVDYLLKRALKEKKIKKPYKYSIEKVNNVRIDVCYIEVPNRKRATKRNKMLAKAKEIELSTYIEDFRLTANKENRRIISNFCNVLKRCFRDPGYTLHSFIENGKEEILKYRGISMLGLELFEVFLKSKNFEFATSDSEKWIYT
jgi:hypothetical protein